MTALTHEFTETSRCPAGAGFRGPHGRSAAHVLVRRTAEIDLKEGGSFRFWGRNTYCTPARWQSRQKVVRVEALSPRRVLVAGGGAGE